MNNRMPQLDTITSRMTKHVVDAACVGKAK
jgi:hypothetical protein